MKYAMCTYHVTGRNEKIVASTYLTNDSVLRRARKQGSFLHIEKVAFNFHDLSLRRLLPHLQLEH